MGDFARDVGLLKSLTSTMASRGYWVEEPWLVGTMSSGRTSMASSVADVRVTADRGHWFVEARPATAGGRWFDLESWSACLGEPVLFHIEGQPASDTERVTVIAESWRLEPQLDWLRSNLDGIEAACADNDHPVHACLESRIGRR